MPISNSLLLGLAVWRKIILFGQPHHDRDLGLLNISLLPLCHELETYLCDVERPQNMTHGGAAPISLIFAPILGEI